MYIIWDPRDWTGSSIQDLLRKDWRDKLDSCCVWHGSKVSAQNLPCILRTNNFRMWVEYGLARLDRLVFYNAYTIWWENREKLVLTYKTHAINVEAHCLNVRVNLLAELWLQELLSVIESSNLTGCEYIVPHQSIVYCENLRNIRM